MLKSRSTRKQYQGRHFQACHQLAVICIGLLLVVVHWESSQVLAASTRSEPDKKDQTASRVSKGGVEEFDQNNPPSDADKSNVLKDKETEEPPNWSRMSWQDSFNHAKDILYYSIYSRDEGEGEDSEENQPKSSAIGVSGNVLVPPNSKSENEQLIGATQQTNDSLQKSQTAKQQDESVDANINDEYSKAHGISDGESSKNIVQASTPRKDTQSKIPGSDDGTKAMNDEVRADNLRISNLNGEMIKNELDAASNTRDDMYQRSLENVHISRSETSMSEKLVEKLTDKIAEKLADRIVDMMFENPAVPDMRREYALPRQEDRSDAGDYYADSTILLHKSPKLNEAGEMFDTALDEETSPEQLPGATTSRDPMAAINADNSDASSSEIGNIPTDKKTDSEISDTAEEASVETDVNGYEIEGNAGKKMVDESTWEETPEIPVDPMHSDKSESTATTSENDVNVIIGENATHDEVPSSEEKQVADGIQSENVSVGKITSPVEERAVDGVDPEIVLVDEAASLVEKSVAGVNSEIMTDYENASVEEQTIDDEVKSDNVSDGDVASIENPPVANGVEFTDGVVSLNEFSTVEDNETNTVPDTKPIGTLEEDAEQGTSDSEPDTVLYSTSNMEELDGFNAKTQTTLNGTVEAELANTSPNETTGEPQDISTDGDKIVKGTTNNGTDKDETLIDFDKLDNASYASSPQISDKANLSSHREDSSPKPGSLADFMEKSAKRNSHFGGDIGTPTEGSATNIFAGASEKDSNIKDKDGNNRATNIFAGASEKDSNIKDKDGNNRLDTNKTVKPSSHTENGIGPPLAEVFASQQTGDIGGTSMPEEKVQLTADDPAQVQESESFIDDSTLSNEGTSLHEAHRNAAESYIYSQGSNSNVDSELKDHDVEGSQTIPPIKSVNTNFVEGLDDIDKFMEAVDPPDELDVGANGSSIQDVLMGQGAQILTKRISMGVKRVQRSLSTVVSRFKTDDGKFALLTHCQNELSKPGKKLRKICREVLQSTDEFVESLMFWKSDHVEDGIALDLSFSEENEKIANLRQMLQERPGRQGHGESIGQRPARTQESIKEFMRQRSEQEDLEKEDLEQEDSQ